MKRLVEEEGSELAAQLWDGCDAAVSSRLAYPEVRASLAAAARSGRLERQAHETTEASWEEFWSATRVKKISQAMQPSQATPPAEAPAARFSVTSAKLLAVAG